MVDLTITINKKYGEADLKFRSATADDLNELHDTVVRAIDGVRVKKKIEDFVVAIRKRDFHEVVQRLKAYYGQTGRRVNVVAANRLAESVVSAMTASGPTLAWPPSL